MDDDTQERAAQARKELGKALGSPASAAQPVQEGPGQPTTPTEGLGLGLDLRTCTAASPGRSSRLQTGAGAGGTPGGSGPWTTAAKPSRATCAASSAASGNARPPAASTGPDGAGPKR